jgi:hypothetical protein
VIDALFDQNASQAAGGGGAYLNPGWSSPADVLISGTRFISNAALNDRGGGAWVEYAGVVVTGGAFTGNAAKGDGGGLYASRALTVSGALFTDNAADGNGGGAYNAYNGGGTRVSGSVFRGNRAAIGAGLYSGAVTTLAGAQFLGNTAQGRAGGAYIALTGAVTGSLFHSNVAGGDGGGLFTSAPNTAITNTRFIANTAARGGGAAAWLNSTTLVNGLFARNTAVTGLGAALFITRPYPSAVLMHLTIASPTVGSGSAVYVYNSLFGKAFITNTLVASYSLGIESQAGGQTREDYSLFYGTAATATGVIAGGHSLIGDPRLANPAADDYRLRSGSPAVDRGAPAGVPFDLDGAPRDGAPDIGAYEWRGASTRLPIVIR